MINFLKTLWKAFFIALKSKYRWLLILFILWLYRVDFISADGGGLAKTLQVVTLFGMFFLTISYRKNLISIAYNRTNLPIQSVLYLYTYALISTAWALIPTFAFFLSFQNLALLLVLIWVFGQFRDFKTMEKSFLMIAVFTMLFEVITVRFLEGFSLFYHFLQSGSAAALCFSYCIAELLAMKRLDKERKILLKWTIVISLIVLVISTSSGANVSAICGFAIALFFSRKVFYSLLLFSLGIFLYLNQDLLTTLMFLVMPGKSLETVSSASGRQALWDVLLNLAAQKPILGWGYACIERAVTNTGFMASDAHNNYLGIYGSLGIIGCAFLGLQFLSTMLYSFKRRMKYGYLGIFAATCCAILNGYSYGFLSGKACSITVIYFSLVVLSFTYSRVNYYDRYGVE